MAGRRHRFSDRPKVIEGEGFRLSASGDYIAFGIEGSPHFDARTGEQLPHAGQDLEPLADGEWSPNVRLMPEWVELELHGRSEPDLHCRIELRDDVPQLVELSWRARPGQTEIRQKQLRNIDVSEFAGAIYRRWVFELRDWWGDKDGTATQTRPGTDQDRIVDGLLADLKDLRSGRRRVNAELLRQVAEVYIANFDDAPAEAVARAFGVKARQAHAYIAKARERGFLSKTTQGKKKI